MTNRREKVRVWGGTLRADVARDVREQRARAGEGPERQVRTWESVAGCSGAGRRDSGQKGCGRLREGLLRSSPGRRGARRLKGQVPRREEVFKGAGGRARLWVLGEQDILRTL